MNIRRIIREELLREANQQSQGYTVQQLQQAMNAGNYQQAYQMLNSVTARTMKERYALQNIGNKLTQMYRSGQMNQQQPAQQNMPNQMVSTMQNELMNGIHRTGGITIRGLRMAKDLCRCNQCGSFVVVDCETNTCPKCKSEGVLSDVCQENDTPNINYYLQELIGGQDCEIFKSVANFDEQSGDKVCYIGDFGLQSLLEYAERNEDLTDAEIISRGLGSSRNSIVSDIKQECDRLGLEVSDDDLKRLAEVAFEEADWTFISTLIDQWDLEEMIG